MADKKMTNLEALEAAVKMATDAGNEELSAKLSKMVESETNKREAAKNRKKNGDSPEKRKTRNKVLEIMRAIVDAGNEPRTVAWVQAHVGGLPTPQAVSGKVLTVSNADKGIMWIANGEREKGKITYYVTDEGLAALNEAISD